jgi:serine protease Do
LPADKGCFLMVNELGAEVTATFTAQDRQWSDSYTLGVGESKIYCLDPGRYTYTLDAPPPWGAASGELTINAGDAFRWPIQPAG